MKTYLIQYHDNWADEMDINGFAILSEKAWNFFLTALDAAGEEFFDDFEIGVGSNESIPYANKERLLEVFKVIDISEQDANVIRVNFNLPYGEFPVDQIMEGIACAKDDSMEFDDSEDEQWFWDELNNN